MDTADSLETSFRPAFMHLVQAVRNTHQQAPIAAIFSNEEALGGPSTPLLPTLHDIHNGKPRSWWLGLDVEKEHTWKDFFMYIRNFAFLKAMRHAESFHDDLPMREDLQDVWVLCRQRGTAVETLRHWTVLTQGHLFHLRAQKPPKVEAVRQSCKAAAESSNVAFLRQLLSKEGSKTPIHYESLDFSCPSTSDSKTECSKKQRKFIAYHVGQTMYTHEEVTLIAKAVIKQMKARRMGNYDFLENNCQHFVLSLVRRIVMTKRKQIAVGGTRLQIAQWNMGLPGYALKKWLTPTRARLLFLPTSYTSKFPKRYFFTSLWAWVPMVVHFKDTIPDVFQNHVWDKTGRQALQDIEFNRAGLKRLRKHIERRMAKFKWAKHDGWTLVGWFAFWGVLSHFLVSVAAVGAAGASASAATSFIAGFAVDDLIIGGTLSYFLVTKLFYNRGSLTITHEDLVRTRPGLHEVVSDHEPSTMDTSTKKDAFKVDVAEVELSDDESDYAGDEGDDERFFPFNQSLLESMAKEEGVEAGSFASSPPPYDSDSDDPDVRPELPARSGPPSYRSDDVTLYPPPPLPERPASPCLLHPDETITRPALPPRSNPPSYHLYDQQAAARPALPPRKPLPACNDQNTPPPLPPRRPLQIAATEHSTETPMLALDYPDATSDTTLAIRNILSQRDGVAVAPLALAPVRIARRSLPSYEHN